MIEIVVENIITDLRNDDVSIDSGAFDAINDFIDIQNSTLVKTEITKWQDLKDGNALFVKDNDVVAVYYRGKFLYNPNKIKISQAPNYDVYVINIAGTDVQHRREQRRDDLSGLSATAGSQYKNVPTSSQYIWDKDWNPEVNKVYYSKLLQRKKLPQYAKMLEDAYDVIMQMIIQRKTRLTGKRTEYNRMIGDIQRQISRIEDLMISAEIDYFSDSDKLKKEISKLPGLVKKARNFMKTEDDEYAVWGKREPVPLKPITK